MGEEYHIKLHSYILLILCYPHALENVTEFTASDHIQSSVVFFNMKFN